MYAVLPGKVVGNFWEQGENEASYRRNISLNLYTNLLQKIRHIANWMVNSHVFISFYIQFGIDIKLKNK